MIKLDVHIKLDSFDGPLDLLLHLIEKSEVNIYEVPIAKITDQYVEVLSAAEKWQIEIASEFLVMAATLIAMKSRMLLPRPKKADALFESVGTDDGSLDPREELVERLLSYKQYKRLGEMLKQREQERNKLYLRPATDLTPFVKPQNPVEGITPDDLLNIFVELLQKEPEEEPVATVVREEISVSDRMNEIRNVLDETDLLRFYELLPRTEKTKEQVITTFLAILELMKLKEIECLQPSVLAEIVIRKSKWVVSQNE